MEANEWRPIETAPGRCAHMTLRVRTADGEVHTGHHHHGFYYRSHDDGSLVLAAEWSVCEGSDDG